MISIANRTRNEPVRNKHGPLIYMRTIFAGCLFVVVTTTVFYLVHLSNSDSYGEFQHANAKELDSLMQNIDMKHKEDNTEENEEAVDTEFDTGKKIIAGKVSSQKQTEEKAQPTRKLFAYYVIAPSCLPDEFLWKSALGNGSRLDVYVNCFTSFCYDNIKPHITYILNRTTTWTSGRNLLYAFVLSLKKNYKYHIFLDDDAGLFFTDSIINYARDYKKPVEDSFLLRMFENDPNGLKHAQAEEQDGKSAWRTFEDDLLAQSPAFATTNLLKFFGFESRSMHLQHWNKMCPNQTTMPWITTTFFLDALFIAYHDEAMPLLFPYSEIYEENWWVSATLQMFRARAILYKHGMCNYKVAVLNKLHREYPRKKIPANIIKLYIQKEAQELKGVLDHRFLDYGKFLKWNHNEEMFYGDPALCTGPLKFPLSKHYRVRSFS